jgi:hypothetical protein
MSIRTRVTSTISAPALPAFLSSAAWPGLRPWLRSVVSSIGIFSLLAGFAWHGANNRLPDMTTLLIAVPAGMISMTLIAAVLWTVFTRASFQASLAFAARVLPLAWIAPLLDLLGSAGKGMMMPDTPLDASGLLLAAVTAGVLPASSILPLGMHAGIVAAVLVTAFVVWFARKNILQSVIAAVVMSAGIIKLSFIASFIGVWHAFMDGAGWVTGSQDTARAALRAVTNGYWWNNVYDRFPSAIDAQADIAIRLTSSGIAVVALGVVLVAIFVWRVPQWKQLVAHTFRSWSTAHLALYPIGGALIYTMATTAPTFKGTWWYALALALLGLAALRLHAVCERRLHKAASPSPGPDDGLGEGDAHAALLADLSLVALLYTLLAFFALGWPVFASLVVFLAASGLSRDRLWASWPWSATVFRAAGAAALALSGFFFISQHARFSGIAALAALIAIAHVLIMEVFWMKRESM